MLNKFADPTVRNKAIVVVLLFLAGTFGSHILGFLDKIQGKVNDGAKISSDIQGRLDSLKNLGVEIPPDIQDKLQKLQDALKAGNSPDALATIQDQLKQLESKTNTFKETRVTSVVTVYVPSSSQSSNASSSTTNTTSASTSTVPTTATTTTTRPPPTTTTTRRCTVRALGLCV